MRPAPLNLSIAAAIATASAVAVPSTDTSAATGPMAQQSLPTTDVELIVIEAPGCIYCTVFRRDVLPAYQASARASAAPLRFLNYSDEAAVRLTLKQPVTIVPTILFLKGHKEVDRIPGTVAPEVLFRTLDQVLGKSD